jgi:hypothetical protein
MVKLPSDDGQPSCSPPEQTYCQELESVSVRIFSLKQKLSAPLLVAMSTSMYRQFPVVQEARSGAGALAVFERCGSVKGEVFIEFRSSGGCCQVMNVHAIG